nr:RHS repeat-associated core domain-containing protein [Pectobacterium parmentieri]
MGDAANEEVYCELRYQGQLYDAETGLCYNRHSYYDAESGQYLSPDPIGLLGGIRPQAYVHNPLEWVDPLGLEKKGPQGLAQNKDKDAKKEGVVYLRTNLQTGEQYVGQAKSDERFAARQAKHDAALGVQHKYKY